MLTLTFIRHGQTDCSLEDRFCGSIDIPLNETGEQMARVLADAYSTESWAALYSSPLLRARYTVEPLAKRLGMEVQVLDGLREIGYGDWEGLQSSEIHQKFPAEMAAWAADPERVPPPGGETAAQLSARAIAAVPLIRDLHADGHVLAVAHKATIRVIVCALLGIDVGLYRMRVAQGVGAATSFQFKDTGPLLLTLNDASMLPPHLRHVGGT